MRKMIARLLVLAMLLAFIPVGAQEAVAVGFPPSEGEESMTIFVADEEEPPGEGYVRYVFDGDGKVKLTYLPDPSLAQNVDKIIVDMMAGEPFGKTEELIGTKANAGYSDEILTNDKWNAPSATDEVPYDSLGETIVFLPNIHKKVVKNINYNVFANHPVNMVIAHHAQAGFYKAETKVLNEEDYMAHGFNKVVLNYGTEYAAEDSPMDANLVIEGLPKLTGEGTSAETTSPFKFSTVDTEGNQVDYLYTFTIYPSAYIENPSGEDYPAEGVYKDITFKAGKHGKLNSTFEESTLVNQTAITYAAGTGTVYEDVPIPDIVPDKGYEVADTPWANAAFPAGDEMVKAGSTHTAQYIPARPVIADVVSHSDDIVITPPPINVAEIIITLPDGSKVNVVKNEDNQWINDDNKVLTVDDKGGIIVPVDPDIMLEGETITAQVKDQEGTTSRKAIVKIGESEADTYVATGSVTVVEGRKVPISGISVSEPLPNGASIVAIGPVDTNVVKVHNTTMTIEFKDGSQKEFPLKVTVIEKGTSNPPVVVVPGEDTPPETPTPPVDPAGSNKDDLQDAIDELEDLLNNDTAYTDSSENAASDVLDKAKDVIKDDKATDEEIKDATAKVKAAIKGLRVAVNLNTKDHWAYMFGYPNHNFRAKNNMTRAEVAAMFSRLYNQPVQDIWAINKFKDGQGKHWYTDAMNRMIVVGVIGGYKDNTIRPNAPVTRAEFAAMAVRFAKIDNNVTGKTFTDVSAKYWAAADIRKASSVGWAIGRKDGIFAPNEPINRAEVVTITNRMLNRSFDSDYGDPNKLNKFNDLNPTYWAFEDIMEATIGHDYNREHNIDDETWIKENGKRFQG